MIRSFACKDTKALFQRDRVRKIPSDIQHVALRKLRMLDAATSLEDLRIPPANRLEKLKGNRQDQYSIRINDQWRICFRFEKGEATDVEITDYH
ncbi:MAG: type II toxin-antitoxin system RelE/ParE family toxin [Candidatus Omnitrophica bacterium]|nr:type II toxin-antitoxin system RelE/ParE family toxin [Candidatus Omnitrophota bacterium]